MLNMPQGYTNGVWTDLQLFAEGGEGDVVDTGDTGGDFGTGGTGESGNDGKDQGGNVGESKDSDGVKPDDAKDTAGKEGEGDSKEKNADLLADWKPKLPDGVEIDQQAFDMVMPVFKELGLNAEQADKLTDVYQTLTKDLGTRIQEDINNVCQTGYDDAIKDLKADKKFGGKAFEENVGHVNAMLEKYGGEEAPKQLQTAFTALAGYDKDAVKPLFTALMKISQDWADPKTKMGSTVKEEKTVAQKHFPNSNHNA
jgi:hypothetical protein